MPVYVYAGGNYPNSQGSITVCQPLTREEAVFIEPMGSASWRVSWPNNPMRRNLVIAFKQLATGSYLVIKVDPSSERKSYTVSRFSLSKENSYDLNELLEQANTSIMAVLKMRPTISSTNAVLTMQVEGSAHSIPHTVVFPFGLNTIRVLNSPGAGFPGVTKSMGLSTIME